MRVKGGCDETKCNWAADSEGSAFAWVDAIRPLPARAHFGKLHDAAGNGAAHGRRRAGYPAHIADTRAGGCRAMTKGKLFELLAVIPDGDPRLRRVEAALTGDDAAEAARPPVQRLFTIAQAARLAGVSRSTMDRAIRARRVRTVRVLDGGRPRVPADALAALVGGNG